MIMPLRAKYSDSVDGLSGLNDPPWHSYRMASGDEIYGGLKASYFAISELQASLSIYTMDTRELPLALADNMLCEMIDMARIMHRSVLSI
jgi:hypothetical protein